MKISRQGWKRRRGHKRFQRGVGRDDAVTVPVHLAHWGSCPLRVVRRKGSAGYPRPGVFGGGQPVGSAMPTQHAEAYRRKLRGGAESAGVSRANVRFPLLLHPRFSFLFPFASWARINQMSRT